MAHLKIYWTETAVRQRNHVFEYWIERNKSNIYVRKLSRKIIERTNVLKRNPGIGKKTEFQNTRAVSLGHYSILYQIIELKIVITGFWDNRQEPTKLRNYLKR